jgi:ABC-type glycerol-3-phosphate transport system substrate-binding protein
MDDLVRQIESAYGPVTTDAVYSGKVDGTWYSAPGPIGTHLYPMVSRLDLWKEHAGIDLKKIFPAGPNRDPALVKSWNYDNFLVGCKKLHAAGFPFGGPLGSQTDAQDWTGALFASYGSYPVDKDGNITFDSDETREALDYMSRLCEYMPKEVYAWDDASNNTWIISGRGSAIQNPPSAWRVAVRDQIVTASKLWHHDTPAGPKGRFRGSLTRMNGVWNFSKNKSAAKGLLLHMLQKEQQDVLIDAAIGYDIPLIKSFNKHPVWKYTGPPDGTLYNYPVQGDEVRMICGYPAPATISAQIYDQDLFPNTVAKITQEGKSIDVAIKWAIGELEGFMRG